MLPSIFGESLFDEFFDEAQELEREAFDMSTEEENALYGKSARNIMKTDVKETDTGYKVDVDLPGFDKDQINVEFNDGYLCIQASKEVNKEEKQESGKYIRKERYSGNVMRSFYIGEDMNKDDIHAKYENGILELTFPKGKEKKVENTRRILIEG